jgi:hypothetical protein
MAAPFSVTHCWTAVDSACWQSADVKTVPLTVTRHSTYLLQIVDMIRVHDDVALSSLSPPQPTTDTSPASATNPTIRRRMAASIS